MLTRSRSQVWIKSHGGFESSILNMSKLVSGPCCGKTHHTRWKFCKHPMIKRSQTAHDNTAFISGANSPTSAARPHKASETRFWAYLSPKPPTWVLHGAPWCSTCLAQCKLVENGWKWDFIMMNCHAILSKNGHQDWTAHAKTFVTV